jgi:hypothetical protein
VKATQTAVLAINASVLTTAANVRAWMANRLRLWEARQCFAGVPDACHPMVDGAIDQGELNPFSTGFHRRHLTLRRLVPTAVLRATSSGQRNRTYSRTMICTFCSSGDDDAMARWN